MYIHNWKKPAATHAPLPERPAEVEEVPGGLVVGHALRHRQRDAAPRARHGRGGCVAGGGDGGGGGRPPVPFVVVVVVLLLACVCVGWFTWGE